MSINKLEYCVGATAFLGASIFTMFKNPNTEKDLERLLNERQKNKYNKIKNERYKIWIKSSLIGIVISLVICSILEENNSNLKKSCTCALIFFIVQYLVYTLYPKSDWMIIHLNTEEQKRAWLENYRIMRLRWIFGMFFGLLGYFQMTFFCYSNI
jgi:hypothetical protein